MILEAQQKIQVNTVSPIGTINIQVEFIKWVIDDFCFTALAQGCEQDFYVKDIIQIGE